MEPLRNGRIERRADLDRLFHVVYSSEKARGEKETLFDWVLHRVDCFMAAQFPLLLARIPWLQVFARNLVECLEDYYIFLSSLCGWDAIESHGDTAAAASSEALAMLEPTFSRLFPGFSEGALLDYPSSSGGLPRRKKIDIPILFLDVDRTYSASLVNIARRFTADNLPLCRLRLPYDSGDAMEASPLEEVIPEHAWAASVLKIDEAHAERFRCSLTETLAALRSDPLECRCDNDFVLAVLERLSVSCQYRRAALFDALRVGMTGSLRARALITADDTWPRQRSVVRRAACPTIKFQDGLLVRHHVVERTLCDLWCVWSQLETRYLVARGLDEQHLLLWRSRVLDSVETGRARHAIAEPGSRRVVYASRPASRDLSTQENEYVLRDLLRLVMEEQNIVLANKMHPSEQDTHFADFPKPFPRGFSVIPGFVSFQDAISDCSLLISGVSLTLYEAPLLGVPAARIVYGPRPNLPMFPDGVYPVVDSYGGLRRLCSAPADLLRMLLERQRDFLRQVLVEGSALAEESFQRILRYLSSYRPAEQGAPRDNAR